MKALKILVVLSSVAAVGCSKPGENGGSTTAEPSAPAPTAEPAAPAAPASLVEIPNARIYESVLVGGQPADQQYADLAKAGYTTIIDFRGVGEAGGEENAAKAAAAGMAYVSLPIASAEDLDKALVQKFADALENAKGPVVAHCASGNRVGAVFGMKAHWIDGASPEHALEVATQAGVTGLADHVKSLLGAGE